MSATALPAEGAPVVTPSVPNAHIVHPAYGWLWTWRLALYSGLTAAFMLGGPLVQLMAAVAGIMSLLMDWDGLFRHVFRWIALVGCIIATPSVAPTVAAQMPANWVGDSFFGIPVEYWISCIGMFILASVFIGVVFRQIRKRPWLNAINHFGGSVFGAGEGAMTVAVLFWGLTTFSDTLHTLEYAWGESNIAQRSPVSPAIASLLNHLPGGYDPDGLLGVSQLSNLQKHLASDPIAVHVNEHNAFERIPTIKATSELTALAADPESVAAVAKNPTLANFARRKDVQNRMKALAADPEVRAALQSRNFNTLVTSGTLRKIVGDKELLRLAQAQLPEIKKALAQSGHAKLVTQAEQLTPQRLAELQQSALHVIAAAETGNKAMAKAMMKEHNVSEADFKRFESELAPAKDDIKAAFNQP